MATLSNNDIAKAIYLSFKDKKEGDLKNLTDNVIKFLIKKRLFLKSKDILDKLEKIINKDKGILKVRISSVTKLTDKIKNELKTEFIRKYKVKEIVLVEKIDNSLLGGIKIEVNDEVIDLTIFNKLKKLQEYLTR
jgi:F-type H+-transporting ATPase subunit delta